MLKKFIKLKNLLKFEFIGSYISPINSVITDEEVWPKTCYEGKENEV